MGRGSLATSGLASSTSSSHHRKTLESPLGITDLLLHQQLRPGRWWTRTDPAVSGLSLEKCEEGSFLREGQRGSIPVGLLGLSTHPYQSVISSTQLMEFLQAVFPTWSPPEVQETLAMVILKV